MPKIVHIGLGKTGTTSLQVEVFPRLVEKQIIKHYNPDLVFNKMYKFAKTGNERELENLDFDKYSDILISCEGLAGWNPAMWDGRADILAKYLPPDVTIIITIRPSEDYARSAYQQSFNEGLIVDESVFFTNSQGYSDDFGLSSFFDIYCYDYLSLVDSYIGYFENVIVLPYENIFNLNFLGDLLNIKNDDFRELLLIARSSKKHNQSLSKNGMKTLGLVSRILHHLNLRFVSNMDEITTAYRKNMDYKPSLSARARRRFFSYFFNGFLFRRKPYALPRINSLIEASKTNDQFYQKALSSDSGYLSFRTESVLTDGREI